MPQPFDYSLNIPNPAQSVMQGIQQGIGLSQGIAQVKQARAEAAGAEQANQRRAAFNADLAKISAAPTAAGYASLLAKYPEFGKVIREPYDVLGIEEQKQNLSDANAVYSALSGDNVEYAKQLLQEQADALRSGGREQDAQHRERIAKILDAAPDSVRTTGALYLAEIMGPEKFAEVYGKGESERRSRDREGAELTEAEAKAEKAATEAKFAESQAVADLEKKGWDVKKIQNDIQVSRENSRIAAMNAALAKETNQQRADLLRSKIADAQLKRDEIVRERVANAESARGNIDNLLNTVDRALKIPSGVLDDITGPVDASYLGQKFTFGQPEADAQELIETIKSQTFLAQVPNLKGTGSLSNAEGDKLQTALQSLSLRQSPTRLINNLREIQRLMLKARTNLSTRFGVPETIPDTPEAAPAEDELNALLDQYGAGAAPVQ